MKKYDVAVIGGGFAGFAAAVASAREGAKTILIEKSGALGGALNLALIMPFMVNGTQIDGKYVRLSEGIFADVCRETSALMREYEGIETDPNRFWDYNDEYIKAALNRIAISSGVELLLHSYVTAANKDGEHIKSVTLAGRSGTFEIEADRFVDATGDANLAYLAGCPFRLGRDDGLCQPMTLCFRIAGVTEEARKRLWTNRDEVTKIWTGLQAEGKIRNPREDVMMFTTFVDGVVHVNSTRVIKLNPTDPFDLTKAEIEAREQVLELFAFAKKYMPGFENAQLLSTACEIGVRESRMIIGDYVLTADDLKACTKFEDSIAFGNYDIDIHSPDGAGTSHYYFKPGEYYSIPYRSLIAKNADNLLVAGRCISTDHDAQASIRIMPIVCTLGEAAGTAAALSVSSNTDIRSIDINTLRTHLHQNGALC